MLARPKIQVAKPYKAAVWPEPIPPGGMVLWYFEDEQPENKQAQKHRSMHEFCNVKMYTADNEVRIYFVPEPPTVPCDSHASSARQQKGKSYESLQVRQAWGWGDGSDGLPSRGEAFRLLKPLFKRCRQGAMEASPAYVETSKLLDRSSMLKPSSKSPELRLVHNYVKLYIKKVPGQWTDRTGHQANMLTHLKEMVMGIASSSSQESYEVQRTAKSVCGYWGRITADLYHRDPSQPFFGDVDASLQHVQM